MLIAALGFVNYVLWKIYGSRGTAVTAFLGGLVNSTAAVAELAGRVRQTGEAFADTAYRGVLLATGAMLLRNAAVLAFLSVATLRGSALALGGMFTLCAALTWRRPRAPATPHGDVPTLQLESPFSLSSALRFGAVFLALEVAGTLGQQYSGKAGFYAVSVAGGLFSSASAVASAGQLAAHGALPVATAANGAVLAALTSALVNLPLIARVAGQPSLTASLRKALLGIVAVGLAGAALQSLR